MASKIDHIGVAVRSIEEAKGFYETLGLAIDHVEVVESEGVRVAMIPCGESRIELLEPTRDDSPIATFLDKRGPGIHHVCLGTGDIVRDDASLREAGVRVLRERPTVGAGGALVQFIHPKSAGGVLVELSQPANDR
ncbi:MAG: methylmalonyl-CoA epimerase [Acidobacteriota bacterium]